MKHGDNFLNSLYFLANDKQVEQSEVTDSIPYLYADNHMSEFSRQEVVECGKAQNLEPSFENQDLLPVQHLCQAKKSEAQTKINQEKGVGDHSSRCDKSEQIGLVDLVLKDVFAP